MNKISSKTANFAPVTITVKPGNILHLQGDKAIGKTALLKIICGINKNHRGEMLVEDTNEYGQKIKIRPTGNAILGNALYKHLSVINNLKLWSRRWSSLDSIVATLHFLQLAKYAHHPIASLNLELQRKVALSRLLACPHPLWIIDEADHYLTQESMTLLADLIHNHANCHKGIVIMTSKNEQISKVANQKLLLVSK